MINDNYLNGLASLMAGTSYDLPGWMAFGSTTGTLTANDLVTTDEFDRNALDSSSTTNNIVKMVGRRLGTTAAGETIRNVGVHNIVTDDSSGYLQLNMLTSGIVHTSDFDLEVEFWVKHERQ